MENLISLTDVSKNMKTARLRAGYTQEQAAAKLGTSRMTVHNWEKDPGGLGFDKWQKLAQLYGVSVSYFFGL